MSLVALPGGDRRFFGLDKKCDFCIDKTGYEYYCINQVIQQYNNTSDAQRNKERMENGYGVEFCK